MDAQREELLRRSGVAQGTLNFMREAEGHKARMVTLRENYDYDDSSPQPMALRQQPTSKLKTAAMTGGAVLAGLALGGAGNGAYKRYATKARILTKIKKLSATPADALTNAAKIARNKGKAAKLPGYVSSVAGGAVHGVTHPLRLVKSLSGYNYLNKNF